MKVLDDLSKHVKSTKKITRPLTKEERETERLLIEKIPARID